MEATIMLRALDFSTHNISDFDEGFQLIDHNIVPCYVMPHPLTRISHEPRTVRKAD
jgi:hypothetical protein